MPRSGPLPVVAMAVPRGLSSFAATHPHHHRRCDLNFKIRLVYGLRGVVSPGATTSLVNRFIINFATFEYRRSSAERDRAALAVAVRACIIHVPHRRSTTLAALTHSVRDAAVRQRPPVTRLDVPAQFTPSTGVTRTERLADARAGDSTT